MKKKTRREFLKATAAGTAAMILPGASCRRKGRPPNIVFFLADDLGVAELGCYGQKKIRTPHLDAMAGRGMRFTQAYSGSPVCAPSRCALLTGKHTGHAYIRDNDEMEERGDVWHDLSLEGQRPLLPSTETLGTMLKRAGYRTACVGKWGLGGPGSSGHPNLQGFDFYYGVLCQRQAHNHYPDHLWRNGEKEMLDGNPYFYPHQRFDGKDPADLKAYDRYRSKVYAPDRFAEEAIRFIKSNQNRPFFLFYTTTIPHAALQVPNDSWNEYFGEFPEKPYLGDKGYLPNPAPRAAYAAMVSRMDRDTGRIASLIRELDLEEDTAIFFSSDNGPTYNGGTDSAFFESAALLRGLKGELYEGGLRVPLIASWPGKIPSGSVTNHAAAFWDMMPTFAEIAGAEVPAGTDGIGLLEVLRGKEGPSHEFLYWEYHAKPSQAVRLGPWKGLRDRRPGSDGKIALYNLNEDPSESRNVAKDHADVVERMRTLMDSRTRSEIPKWNFTA